MNTKMSTPSHILALLGILLVALTLRLPGMMWGFHPHAWPHFLIYHPDENSLAQMARQFLGGPEPANFFYPKGFSFSVAVLSMPLKHWLAENPWLLIMVGRLMSVAYSVLTVLLLFFIARRLFKNTQTALIACAVLALTGLNVTYAHFAVVDSGVVFWIYAAMYFALRYLDGDGGSGRALFLSVLCCGMAMAFKMSFIVRIPLMYVLAVRKAPWWVYVLALVLVFFVFELASGFKYTLQDFQLTLHNVSADNVRSREYNKWLNPVCYSFILIPLIGLPVFLTMAYGTVRMIKDKFRSIAVQPRHGVFIFLLPLAIHLISICCLTFIAARHLLLFTPVFAMLSAAAIAEFAGRHSWANRGFATVLGLLVAYQVVFVVSTEYYFVFDPREPADAWVRQHVPKGETIALPAYSNMPDLWSRNKVVSEGEAKYLVLQEANYGRYLKSIVNPFIAFPSFNQIHHAEAGELKIIQGIFKNELPYQLLKKFEINPVTPEKMLYKSVYGNVWPEGDVSIYKRID